MKHGKHISFYCGKNLKSFTIRRKFIENCFIIVRIIFGDSNWVDGLSGEYGSIWKPLDSVRPDSTVIYDCIILMHGGGEGGGSGTLTFITNKH